MSPSVRILVALAVGALLLAFAASLSLVTVSSGESTPRPQKLNFYGNR